MSYEQKRVEYLKEKFNLPYGLQINGLVAKPRPRTVEDAVIEKDRADAKNMKLATGEIRVTELGKSKLVRLWCSHSK